MEEMNTIKRDVYVLRNTIKIPIEVTKGTDAISFEFTVRDYNLPVTAAAVAYAYRMGMKKPNSTLCDVSGNVISFQPSANFFEVGNNELQIRVINEDKSLISFKEKVKCSDSMGFPDEEEEVDQSLIEQIIAQSGKESGERKAADAQERAERIESDTKEKSERLKEIATERARIDQLTKMGEGSTTGDAELADIRVGNEGATYSNAGNAVRSQTKDVPAMMDNLQSPYVDISLLEQGSINSAVGSEIASSKVLRSVEFHWNKNGKITAPAGYKIAIANYAMQLEESGQMTKVYMSFENYSDSQTSSKADGDAESRRLLIKRSDGADINAEDLRGKITTNVPGLRAMDVIENLEKKIKTDITLEKEGVAADAAETGKRISQVEGGIKSLDEDKVGAYLTITSSEQISSLADAEPNRIYLIGIDKPDTLPDFPSKTQYGTLVTFNHKSGINDGTIQIFGDDTKNGFYIRQSWGSKFGEWINIHDATDELKLIWKSMLLYTTEWIDTGGTPNQPYDDVNTFKIGSIVSGDFNNVKNNNGIKNGIFITLGAKKENYGYGAIQIGTSKKNAYIRTNFAGWGDWINLNTDLSNFITYTDIYKPNISMFENIGVVGDSYSSGGMVINGEIVVKYGLSFPQVLKRQTGVDFVNYSNIFSIFYIKYK